MVKTKEHVAEMRLLGDAELLERLSETRRELFNLRFQLATGQLDNSSRLGSVRRDIARLATFLREREIAAAEAAEEGDREDGAVILRRSHAHAGIDRVLGCVELVVGLVQILKRLHRSRVGVYAEHFWFSVTFSAPRRSASLLRAPCPGLTKRKRRAMGGEFEILHNLL